MLKHKAITLKHRGKRNRHTPSHTTSCREFIPDPFSPNRPTPSGFRRAQPQSVKRHHYYNNDHYSDIEILASNNSNTDRYTRVQHHPTYHEMTDGEHPPKPIHASVHSNVQQDLKVLESIEMYNQWLGRKLSTPLAQSLQSLLVSHGVTAFPSDDLYFCDDAMSPKHHLLNILIDHGVLLQQDDSRVSDLLSIEKHSQNDIDDFKVKFNTKQQHIITVLDQLMKLQIITPQQLHQHKIGYVNPNIPFKRGCYHTNQFDKTLEISQFNEDGNREKRTIPTIIDKIIDSMRAAGMFDVRFMDIESLEDAMTNLSIKKKQFHPPPSGENHKTPFNNTKLTVYDPSSLDDHPVTLATVDYYNRFIKDNANLAQLIQLHDLHYRHDVVYSFRTKFERQYQRTMAYKLVMTENKGVIPTNNLSPHELKLFKSLIYDCYLQKSLQQHFLHAPEQNLLYNIQVDNIYNVKDKQKKLIQDDIQEKLEIQNKLKGYVMGSINDYPTIALYSTLINSKNIPEDEKSTRMEKIKQLSIQMKKRTMIIPPEENYKQLSLIKFLTLLYNQGIITKTPSEDDMSVDISAFILKIFTDELKLFTYKPENNNDPINITHFKIQMREGEEPFNMESEEFEILDILVDLGVIPESQRHNFQPNTFTPLILRADSDDIKDVKARIRSEQYDAAYGENAQEDAPDLPRTGEILENLHESLHLVLADDNHEEGEGMMDRSSILLTKPYIAAPDDVLLPGDGNFDQKIDEPIYKHDIIRVKGYSRTEMTDKQLSSTAIEIFDKMLANVTDPTQLRVFTLQFFRHDVFMKFACDHPALFTKFVGMSKFKRNVQNSEDPLADDLYTKEELDELKWMISNLHVQYHLVKQYKKDRMNEIYIDPNTKQPNMLLNFNHVSVNGITDQSKQYYMNNLFNNKYLEKI